MNIVELKGVGVSYGTQRVLSGVNLEIRSDDFMAVVGPNGGGKTSLVKAILGLVPHQEGSITLHDQLKGEGGAMKIGYMPQISLFDRAFPITIEEVVLSALVPSNALFGWSRYTSEQRHRAEELMIQMRIEDIAHKRIGELSGGQLQRALLCRAIISEPRLLILDEPTNFIDCSFEEEFYRLLSDLNSKMAIVMVSHDIGSVSAIVKQIVCVNGTVHRHDSDGATLEALW